MVSMKPAHKKERAARTLRAAVDESATVLHAAEKEESRLDTGSLQRGLAVLTAIIKAERPVTSNEVAGIVGLSASTTHRLLKSLVDLGYLYRDGSKRYFPSAQALFPADLFHPLSVLRRSTAEHLVTLRNKFGQASSFVLFLGGKRWVIETIHGHEALSPYNEIEVTAPLHATVSGKLLLSGLSEDQRAELLGPGPYQRLTSSTIVDPQQLREQLERVAHDGYVFCIDELLQGLGAVGAPVWSSPRQMLGVVALAGPRHYFEGARGEALAAAVREAAGILSHASPGVRAIGKFLGY